MMAIRPLFVAAFAASLAAAGTVVAQTTDPRLREITYDAKAVVSVRVKRGVVTHLVLGADEAITEVASGLGSECAKADAVWCIAAQAGGRHLFVKPRSGAGAPNNVEVVTDKRTHSFTFTVLPDRDPHPPVYRLVIKAPIVRTVTAFRESAPAQAAAPTLAEPDPGVVVAERLGAAPEVVNTTYSIAEGTDSDDIVPTLVFDDGRFTYLRFPGNREVPAVFHVLGDGSETLVNTRMEGDLLVVDRVSRRLMLRAGAAVVGVWNEAFDLDGAAPSQGTTVSGVERVVKTPARSPISATGAMR